MSKYEVFSGSYFPALGLNTERYRVSSHSGAFHISISVKLIITFRTAKSRNCRQTVNVKPWPNSEETNRGFAKSMRIALISLIYTFRTPCTSFPASMFDGLSITVWELFYWTNSNFLRQRVDYNFMWSWFICWLEYIVFSFRTDHWVVLQDGTVERWKPSRIWSLKSFFNDFYEMSVMLC